jgi:hypothetical protein
MRINSLSLPHPVLGIEDDVTGSYSVECSVALTPEKAVLSITQKLSNKTLEEMISNGNAAFNIEVQCRQTIFRKSYVSDKNEYTIEIPSKLLRNRVDVSFYIVSLQNKADYQIDGANRDYGNHTFEIQKGDVLATGGGTWFPAMKDWRALKAADSFMTVDRGTFKDGPAKIFLDRQKIGLELSIKDYELYSNHCRRISLYPIFHSSLVYPVLLYALYKIKDDPQEYSSYQWFTALSFQRDNEEELSKIDWSEEQNLPKIAQLILDDPVGRMLKAADSLIKQTSEQDE